MGEDLQGAKLKDKRLVTIMDLMVTTDRLGGLAMEDGDTMQNLADRKSVV